MDSMPLSLLSVASAQEFVLPTHNWPFTAKIELEVTGLEGPCFSGLNYISRNSARMMIPRFKAG